MIYTIVAVDENWGIGKDGDLLIRIPEDMKRFQELTTKKINPLYNTMVVCGRKTYESIPEKYRPLKDRNCTIITRNTNRNGFKKLSETEVNVTLDKAKEFLNVYVKDNKSLFDIYIIGGGEIYKELLLYSNKVFVTKVYKSFNADTFFPNLEEMKEFKIKDKSKKMDYKGVKFQYLEYEKK